MLFKGKFIDDKLVLRASHASVDDLLKSLIEYLNKFADNIQSEEFSGCVEIRINEETVLNADDEALLHKEIEHLNHTLEDLKTGNGNTIHAVLSDEKVPVKKPLKVRRTETFDVFTYKDVADEQMKQALETNPIPEKKKSSSPLLLISLVVVLILVVAVVVVLNGQTT